MPDTLLHGLITKLSGSVKLWVSTRLKNIGETLTPAI